MDILPEETVDLGLGLGLGLDIFIRARLNSWSDEARAGPFYCATVNDLDMDKVSG